MESGINKKIYRPLALWLITSPWVIAVIVLTFYGFLGLSLKLPGFDNLYWSRITEVLLAIIALTLFVFLSWLLIDAIVRQKIVLGEHEIYAPQNTCFKSQSYQMEVHIPYSEIADISCKVTTKTSENKSVWYLWLPREWAIFKMKDGKTKRLCLGLYMGKTIERIFDDIIARCAAVGNILDVPCGKELLKLKNKTK